MPQDKNDLLGEVALYYTGKLAEHGATPRGVDWNGEAGQFLRFEQLCRLFDRSARDFSVNDLGCGYGALLEFLKDSHPDLRYCGIDVSESMVHEARSRHAGFPGARFICAATPDGLADYGVASGIFNVRQQRSDAEWLDYIKSTLLDLDRTSRLGVAFNCLTSYSDAGKRRPDLYYADPCEMFGWCKRNLAKDVALLHDYGLYEFTVLVRKAV